MVLWITVVGGCIFFVWIFSSLLLLGRCSGCFKKGSVNTLIVTAHPDDETMFFGPAITALHRYNNRTVLLCLSEGDYYGAGKKRRKELLKAASILRLDHVQIVNDLKLPDGPKCNWSTELLCQYIKNCIDENKIKRIVSFDERGVSNHPNHVAVNKALRQLCDTGQLEDNTEVFVLETVCLWRKYLSVLDVPATLLLTSSCYIISDVVRWRDGMVALSAHSSQMVWFRQLYMIFSRYMFINTFKKLIK